MNFFVDPSAFRICEVILRVLTPRKFDWILIAAFSSAVASSATFRFDDPCFFFSGSADCSARAPRGPAAPATYAKRASTPSLVGSPTSMLTIRDGFPETTKEPQQTLVSFVFCFSTLFSEIG